MLFAGYMCFSCQEKQKQKQNERQTNRNKNKKKQKSHIKQIGKRLIFMFNDTQYQQAIVQFMFVVCLTHLPEYDNCYWVKANLSKRHNAMKVLF